MYTIIAGTNRDDSNTLRVAQQYQHFLKEVDVDAQVFSLKDIKSIHRDDDFVALENKYLANAEKFIFIVPEYNGAFPGILKLMIDISDLETAWYGKKVLMTGIATGRSGNLRGLDALTNICNYIKMQVLPNKIPLSLIHKELDDNGKFNKTETVKTIRQQINEFISF